jgi:uncharacterized SAM-binding protein YcdF (DUF218 family)
MSPKEQFVCMLPNDPLEKADAIALLEGDNLDRIPEAARLFKEGFAPLIVITGGFRGDPAHSTPASEMKPEMVSAGVPEKSIVLEESSQNTREQAVEVMKLAQEKAWKKLIIVASHYHQYRAFLTFLKAMREAELDLVLMNAPVRDLPWFKDDTQGKRVDLLAKEFERIAEYQKKGHVASYEDGIEYLQWKESRR